MQRQRGGLIPIGDALSGMGGPMKSIREATPQALHHFTLSDQVNALVGASEADPDLGFMAVVNTIVLWNTGYMDLVLDRRCLLRTRPHHPAGKGKDQTKDHRASAFATSRRRCLTLSTR